MNKTLEKAILLTYQKYNVRQVKGAMKAAINKGAINGFTNDQYARDELTIRKKEDFQSEIFNQYIEYVLNSDKPENNLESAIQTTYKKYQHREDAIRIVQKCLSDLYKGDNHFTRDNNERAFLDEIKRRSLTQENFQDWMLDLISKKITKQLKLEKNIQSQNIPQNVQTYGENIIKLRDAMISGLTHDKEGSIQIANMQAATTIGNKRPNQEDAVLLIVHPENPEFKMMVVADGMGGYEAGEDSSHMVVEEFKNWFSKLPSNYYKNIGSLQGLLNQQLNETSNKIYSKYLGKGGATFVGAIVGEKETLISNVGDSRGYITKGKELIPVTKDQSLVQNLYEGGEIETRDDMRFHKFSNVITQYVGGPSVNPNFYLKDNKEYDTVLLFSDGVTDCLSDNQILAITRTTDKKQLVNKILENALTNISIARSEIATDPNYNTQIPPGKDNTTAAALFNEKNNDER